MMQFKYFVIVCFVFLAACAGEAAIDSAPPADQPASQANPSAPSSRPDDRATAAAIEPSGTFVSGEHETQGSVRIRTENGDRYLELDSDFQTSTSGPDLYVVLHRSTDVIGSTNPPAYPLQEQDYLILDRLQSYSGAQRYQLPEDINLADFNSVVIWCRMFNATFGAARLEG